MACLRCGSVWVTLKGKDMASCPECCKLQRWKARKQGRLPATVQKTCRRCGCEFKVAGSGISHRVFCKACSGAAKAERRKAYKAQVANGQRTPDARPPTTKRQCRWCGKKLSGTNKKKYCSQECFHAARNAGVQPWDRTGQIEGAWHRGGRYACAPSRKGIHAIVDAFAGFINRVNAISRRVECQRCLTCGCAVWSSQSKFCCEQCKQSFAWDTQCCRCGAAITCSGSKQGRKRVCLPCKARLERECKNKCGRNYRSRARHHGVKYVSFPRRMIFERDQHQCQLCGRKVLPKVTYRKSDGKIHPRSPTIDHIVPMAKGGNHEPLNCQTACFVCNSLKRDKGGGQLRLQMNSGELAGHIAS